MRKSLLFLLLLPVMLQAQITGTVVDETGQPLIGAAVRVVGSDQGTITDFDGAFTLLGVAADATIEVSYVGYLPEELRVESLEFRGVIQLKPDVQNLEEVIVVGYGASKIKDLTSPIEVVKGDKISAVPTASAIGALQGQVAGVHIVNSGVPGSAASITIRGLGSFSNNAPLYVVDGMFYDNINFLNNNDIEEISVMKDASAAAIYGVRAANGVIIVTTKHGKKGQQRPDVTYDGYVGLQTVSNILPMCSSNEYAQMLMEADPTAYTASLDASMNVYGGSFNPETGVYNLNQNTNWYNQLLRPAVITNHSVNVNGGSEKATYGLGISYLYQNGIMNTTNDYNKMTIRGNVDYTPVKWLTVGINTIFSNSTQQLPNNAAWQQAFNMPGIFPAYDNTTKDIYTDGYASPETVGLANNFYNPVATANLYNAKNRSTQILANIYAQFNIWKDKLALRTSYNYDHTGMRANTYLPQYYIGAFQQNPTSTLYKSQTQFNNWIWDNTLTYNDQWGKHAFKAMLGLSLREERMDFIQGVAQEVLPEESYQYISLGNQESQTVSDNGSRTRGFSYFGRVSYSYDDRYMIMATVRRDGSSKYNEKWGTFPSVGLAWTISNEPWAKGHKNFDYLKLRASWGLLGNDKIAPSVGELTVTPAEAVFGGMNVIDGFINATTFSWLTWEKVNETNIGTSFGFFGNRLTGDLDWYYRLTQNAVCSARLPMQDADGTGNWATILNMGVDLNLNWEHKVNKDWTYFIGGNVSWLQNKVKSLFGSQQILKGGKTVQMVGEKMNSYYGYKVLGVYQNEEEIANDPIAVANNLKPGDFRYEDVNNDGEMNDKDKQILGSYIPDWTYGIHLGFRYRGLDLTIGLAGQAGGEMWNRKRALRYACNTYNFDKNQYDNRWHGEGTSNTAPSAGALMKSWNIGETANASYFVEPSDYFRIQNIVLGYTFTNVGAGAYKMPSIRLSLTADKPYTYFKANAMTPELTDAQGWDTEVYPLTATWSFAVQLKF